MEQWHILFIGLLRPTYLLAQNIQMNEIQNDPNARKINTKEKPKVQFCRCVKRFVVEP